jgi:hypothetical protein
VIAAAGGGVRSGACHRAIRGRRFPGTEGC